MLEAKATLNFNNSSRQPLLGSAEQSVLHFCARTVEIEWLQIQQIEDVEEVGLYLEGSSFTEKAA
jgi:hypothetical protein